MMFGARLNKLGAAVKRAFTPSSLFRTADSGHVSTVNPAYEDAYQVYNTSTLAASPGDPIGRIARMAGSFDWSQSTSGLRGTLGRFPDVGIRNLFTVPTEDLTNAGWSKAGNSSISGTIAMGDKTLNDFIEDGLSSGHAITRSLTIAAGATVSFSAHIKNRSSNRFVRLQVSSDASANGFRWLFNPTTGLTALSAAAFGTGSVGTPVITAEGGGYRISISGTCAAAATTISVQVTLQDQDASYLATYLGDSASGVYMGALQYETSAVASPYQKVTSATDITESGYPRLYLPYFNGSQWMTAGTGTFGTASLFADAGQSWTVWFVWRDLAGVGSQLIAKAGATIANMTFRVGSSVTGISITCRGSTTTPTLATTDGSFHVGAVRWDGTTLRYWLDKNAAATATVGAAAEEAQNILISARTESSPAGHLTGYNAVAMIGRAFSDAEMTQLMSSLNSTYRKYL